jgi:hypothetical protein
MRPQISITRVLCREAMAAPLAAAALLPPHQQIASFSARTNLSSPPAPSTKLPVQQKRSLWHPVCRLHRASTLPLLETWPVNASVNAIEILQVEFYNRRQGRNIQHIHTLSLIVGSQMLILL